MKHNNARKFHRNAKACIDTIPYILACFSSLCCYVYDNNIRLFELSSTVECERQRETTPLFAFTSLSACCTDHTTYTQRTFTNTAL
jgi:hypothetical protein